MGEHDTSDSVTWIYSAANIRNHPSFESSDGNYDVSILILTNTITFSDTVGPTCLPASLASHYSATLMEVNVTVVSNEECEGSYGSSKIKE